MQVKDLIPINGKRLRLYRRRLSWSQETLAEAAKISRSYVAEIEKGNRLPRELVAESLAEALGVSVKDLIESPTLKESAKKRKDIKRS